ncbi:hypothetical protein TRVL_07236 [Trypanosoma vivax]|nr:hypothetical protein TRVL_07236 [Trypanosoma vivax]
MLKWTALWRGEEKKRNENIYFIIIAIVVTATAERDVHRWEVRCDVTLNAPHFTLWGPFNDNFIVRFLAPSEVLNIKPDRLALPSTTHSSAHFLILISALNLISFSAPQSSQIFLYL